MIDINKNYNEDCLVTMAKMPDEFSEVSKEYCKIIEERIKNV